MKFLRFTMAAPLQSWGEAAPWNFKETALMPTKAGIIGLLGACFGYERENPALQKLSDNLLIAVRADVPGHLTTDFQMVHSNKGYMVNAEGKKRTPKGTDRIIVQKYYLQEARFTVFLQGEESVLKSVYDAMMAPRFLTYFGRKICVPSEPLIPEWVEAQNLFEVVGEFTEKDKENITGKRVQVEIETRGKAKTNPHQRVYTRRDRMVNGCDMNYALRDVTSYYINV